MPKVTLPQYLEDKVWMPAEMHVAYVKSDWTYDKIKFTYEYVRDAISGRHEDVTLSELARSTRSVVIRRVFVGYVMPPIPTCPHPEYVLWDSDMPMYDATGVRCVGISMVDYLAEVASALISMGLSTTVLFVREQLDFADINLTEMNTFITGGRKLEHAYDRFHVALLNLRIAIGVLVEAMKTIEVVYINSPAQIPNYRMTNELDTLMLDGRAVHARNGWMSFPKVRYPDLGTVAREVMRTTNETLGTVPIVQAGYNPDIERKMEGDCTGTELGSERAALCLLGRRLVPAYHSQVPSF